MNKQDTETQPGKARDWLIPNVPKDELKYFGEEKVVSTYTLIPNTEDLRCPEGEPVVNITTKSEWHCKDSEDNVVNVTIESFCDEGGIVPDTFYLWGSIINDNTQG